MRIYRLKELLNKQDIKIIDTIYRNPMVVECEDIADNLYNFNRQLSLKIIHNKPLTIKETIALNIELGKIIQELRR